MSLVVISGRSGSGKSIALGVLEDLGYYCIDNLPITLLQPLIERLAQDKRITNAAVSIDARNIASDLALFPSVLQSFAPDQVDARVIYLDAASPALVKRFSETRRKHPLSNEERGLREALELETQLLDPMSDLASLTIDTTSISVQELRDLVRTRVPMESGELALLFQSFAYKKGVPVDADLVFDVRCLPNPHWEPELRNLTGLDEPVQRFLTEQQDFKEMLTDIKHYLDKWLPSFEANNRSYVTVAVGCTGGQHRSVFLCLRLYDAFKHAFANVQLRHRELGAAVATQAQQ
ncbi:MAG: RNase adapter RapZ [Pseudomonadales bacterium]